MGATRSILLALALAAGCSSSDQGPAEASPASDPSTVAPSRTAFEVTAGPGAPWATLEPKDEGYRLRGGSLDGGKLKVGADRVKLASPSGGTVAKVKVKDYGFKIYRDDEAEVAKVKRKGAGFKLSDAAGTTWGELEGSGGTLGGEPVTVEAGGELFVVKRGGVVVGEVGSAMSPKAAAFLAVTEIAMEQRVAAMLFVQEKMQ